MKVIKQHAEIIGNWSDMDLYQRCEFAGRISHKSDDKIKEGSAEEFVHRMVKLGHESVFEFARVGVDFSPDSRRYMRHVNLRTVREQVKKHIKSSDETTIKDYLLGAALAGKYPAFFADIDEADDFWREKIGYAYGVETKESPDAWVPVMFTTNRAISHQLVRYRREIVFIQESQRYVKFHDDVEFVEPSVYFDENKTDGRHMRQVWKEAMEGAEQDYIHALSKGCSAQAARLFLPNSAATRLIAYASPEEWKHILEQRTSPYADPMMRELMVPLYEQFYGVMP